MSDASYSLIQYIPDPARSEALNVGIIVWSGVGYALRIDELAVARVVRENPQLERDALLYLGPFLEKQLLRSDTKGDPTARLLDYIHEHGGYPVRVSEPRFAAARDETPESIADLLDQLITRIVRPRRRAHGGSAQPVQILERELRPWLRAGSVQRSYFIQESRSGVGRHVDFFVNSKRNLALDVLKLSLQRADQIRMRADAEAFKIWDLLDSSQVKEYAVYCDFPLQDALAEARNGASAVIESAGGRVVSDFEEARDVLAAAADG